MLAQVFELGGDVVAPALAHGLMRLVAEGAGEGDEAADTELRAQAATAYLRLLAKPKLPDILLKARRHVAGHVMRCAPMSTKCGLAEPRSLPCHRTTDKMCWSRCAYLLHGMGRAGTGRSRV